MEKLPGEVLSEICVRLLAKQIGQMRCVCKPRNALLSDSSFVKSHLHHSIQNNDDTLLFFGSIFFFERSPFTARTSRSPDLELTNFIKIPVSPKCEYGCGSVIGSVNGLICFRYGSCHKDYDVHIWNPSLSAMLSLPTSSFPSSKIPFVLGFGYDPKSDDYKVVKLTAISGSPQAEIYSMRKGSWESISQSFPCPVTMLTWQNQVCVNDHLYWLGTTNLKWKREAILAFDLGAETFSEIPLPDSLLHYLGSRTYCLGVFAGKLCVVSRGINDNWEVWVMDEYGVADSWAKIQVLQPFSGDITPYGFTSHNEFLFQVGGDIDHFFFVRSDWSQDQNLQDYSGTMLFK